MSNINSKKIKTALLINSYFTNKERLLLHSINEESIKNNTDLIVFPIKSLEKADKYNYTYFNLINLINNENIDLIITASVTFIDNNTIKMINNQINNIPKIPVIDIGSDIKALSSIKIDSDTVTDNIFYEAGKFAFNLAEKILNNKKIETCYSIEASKKTLKINHNIDVSNLNKLEILLSSLGNAETYKDLELLLKIFLKDFNINFIYVILFKDKLKIADKNDWIPPENAYLKIGIKKNTLIKENGAKLFKTAEIIPENLLAESGESYLINSIYHKDILFGYFIIEMNIKNFNYLQMILLFINNIINLISILEEKRIIDNSLNEKIKEITAFNKKLKNISQSDELTGLYNRKGFVEYAEQQLDIAQLMNHNGILFFFDLDYLKYINENHGHEEGDFAIVMAGEILKNTFRGTDLIGRIGGDEFTIFATNIPDNFEEFIASRIIEKIKYFNNLLNKPYEISMSMGYEKFNTEEDDELSINNLIFKANQKALRKHK